jgi:23S rRNA (guanosine2251-2'-O)-methyltransferase
MNKLIKGRHSKIDKTARSGKGASSGKTGPSKARLNKSGSGGLDKRGPGKTLGNRPAKSGSMHRADKGRFDDQSAVFVYGKHAVLEALKNKKRRIHALYYTNKNQKLVQSFLSNVRTAKEVEPAYLKQLLGEDATHQGIVIKADPLPTKNLADVMKSPGLIVMLDHVTDPHNLGAILRSACAFGAKAVVVPPAHTLHASPVVAKVASGAVEHMPLIIEKSLVGALDILKKHHFVVYGLDERGEDLTVLQGTDCAHKVLVLGAEGAGLQPRITRLCDHLIALPTKPPIGTLNVSNAAAVTLFALGR